MPSKNAIAIGKEQTIKVIEKLEAQGFSVDVEQMDVYFAILIDEGVKELVQAAKYGLASSKAWETHGSDMKEPVSGIRPVIEFSTEALEGWEVPA